MQWTTACIGCMSLYMTMQCTCGHEVMQAQGMCLAEGTSIAVAVSGFAKQYMGVTVLLFSLLFSPVW